MINRRRFIQAGACAALLLASKRRGYASYSTQATPLWKTSFRGVGPGGIPVAAADLTPAPVTGVAHYTIDINAYTDQVHPTLGQTRLWGYNPARPLGGGAQLQKHLGGIIVAQKGAPIQITFRNNLPNVHILPVDSSIMGADGAQNRVAVHLHGGFVPWISDGGPNSWFAPGGARGDSFRNGSLNPLAAPNEADYFYPNQQSARLMWYHDHAIGITRLNAYAGIASAYIIRDPFEDNLKNQGLPEYVERSVLGNAAIQELPIVVQDKVFVGLTVEPGWTGPGEAGSLWYAHKYDMEEFGKLGPAPAGELPAVSCVPEFFGDTMLANGTVYPEVNVEPRRYRLRILNACNARFLNLQLYVDDGSANGITLNSAGIPVNAPALNPAAANPQGKPTSNFLVLGTEGGFLPSPAFVASSVPFNGTPAGGSLLLAPAERADVLFDFSQHAGKKLILYTDVPAPFPMGDPGHDYFPGLNPSKNPVNATTPAGFGPNTRVIMRFVIGATTTGQPDAALSLTKSTNLTAGNAPLLVPLGVTTPPPGVPVRQLTLNEGFDEHGRLIQFLGTNQPSEPGAFGRAYMDAATETPKAGETEVWQIANLTADTHPIHFHLVNVQIVSRQPFAVHSYTGTPSLKGAPVPPGPEERGWKETVRMNPGEVTTVIMKFDLPKVDFAVPTRNGGHEYVWHCHILEHEEHDMMRPLVVL